MCELNTCWPWLVVVSHPGPISRVWRVHRAPRQHLSASNYTPCDRLLCGYSETGPYDSGHFPAKTSITMKVLHLKYALCSRFIPHTLTASWGLFRGGGRSLPSKNWLLPPKYQESYTFYFPQRCFNVSVDIFCLMNSFKKQRISTYPYMQVFLIDIKRPQIVVEVLEERVEVVCEVVVKVGNLVHQEVDVNTDPAVGVGPVVFVDGGCVANHCCSFFIGGA